MLNKQQVNIHFSRNAQYYDEYAVVQKQMAHNLIDMVKLAGEFRYILEIGCGTGFFTRLLAELYPKAKIIATDISEEMLKTAANNLRAFSNIEYRIEDGEQLKLSGQFDLIVSNAAFQWFTDYQLAFKQFDNRLAAGGYLMYGTFGRDTFYELDQSFKAAQLSVGIPHRFYHGPRLIEIESLEHFGCELSHSVYLKDEHVKQNFASVKEFLRSVKKVGANNANNSKSMIINRQFMLSMINHYEKNFNHKGKVQATYHVIYGSHQKK
ncbi:malonyl-ACP O-methyltransferase BioC [Dendrosporobacter sp. 1207_IL3150]|uniref:malonyl-ACP O-methyltransferase BioC n=1 Tax=Dendrosporobacter sp. 1207_IL3150 TaxID=3084054 RepID=UPI002FDB54FB